MRGPIEKFIVPFVMGNSMSVELSFRQLSGVRNAKRVACRAPSSLLPAHKRIARQSQEQVDQPEHGHDRQDRVDDFAERVGEADVADQPLKQVEDQAGHDDLNDQAKETGKGDGGEHAPESLVGAGMDASAFRVLRSVLFAQCFDGAKEVHDGVIKSTPPNCSGARSCPRAPCQSSWRACP